MAKKNAVIGNPSVVDVYEDATHPTLSIIGKIKITDSDQGEAAFQTTVKSVGSTLGTLTLSADGSYKYSVDDSKVQYLGAGDTKVDTFTITSVDGTTKQVSFTIHGTNDAAVIGTPTQHDVTEDATRPILYAIGTVSISDADQGEAAFRPAVLAGSGNLGTLVIGSNGAYIYAVLDSAVQYLGAADTKVDTFTLTSVDGTTKQVSFTIHGVNDAAVIGAPTIHDVTEDVNVSPAGNLTASGTISISDADQNQSSFQTTVVAGPNTLGHLTIAANGAYTYTVSNAAVQYLDAGQTKVDTFTVTALDGTTRQVSFSIHGAAETGNHAPSTPVDANAAANTIAEGAAAGSAVGITASSTDVDGQTVTYSLTGDTSHGGFTINASSGVITVADPTKIDFETSGATHSYTVTAQASDGTLASSQTFTIGVTDVAPSVPVDANAAANTIAEGAAAGTTVGITASSTDVNGPAVTYSLIGDTSGGGFTINAATGVVTVADPTKIDFESSGPSHTYTITAQASDGTQASSQTFTIGVTDVAPSVPVDFNVAANTVVEGAAAGTTVGITASSTDVNGPAVTYSLIGDTSGGAFTVNAATGVITVADPTKIDFETSGATHSYAVTAQASDGTQATSQTFTIGVTDAAPFIPVDFNAATNTVVEGAANGSTVGITASSTDVNGPAVTYSLIGDTSGGGFTINAATGVVTVADSTKIDFESSGGSYTVTAQASDGTQASSQTFIIGVSDAPPSTPVDSDGAANQVSQNAPVGTYTGVTASSTDVNGPAVTYSLTGDTSGGGFTVNAATGQVMVADSTKIPYNAGSPSFDVTVQASDGTDTSQQTFTIKILQNTPPVANDDALSATEAGGVNNAVPGSNPSGNVILGTGSAGAVQDTDAQDPSIALTVVAVHAGPEGASTGTGTVNNPLIGSHGTLTLNSDGSYTYTVNQTDAQVQALHTSADTLTDQFNYTIQDTGGLQETATLAVTIHGADDLPVANADTGTMTEDDALTSFNVIANDTQDPDSTATNAITIRQGGIVTVTGPAGETFANTDATASIVSNQVQLTLNNAHFQQLRVGESATVTVPYTLTGDTGEISSANLVVTINGVNDVPVAVDDTGSMTEDQSGHAFTVLTNDTLDPDHTAPNNVTVNGATVTNLSAPADEGISTSDIAVSVNGSNQVVVNLGSNFQHMRDGQTATFDVAYTLHGDQPGDTSTAELHVTVTGVNDAPIAGNFTFSGANSATGNTDLVVNDPMDGAPSTTGPAKTITASLLSGAFDVDGPGSLIVVAGNIATAHGGSVVMQSDGDFIYKPPVGYTGSDSFSYQVSDQNAGASGVGLGTGTVTINVSAPKVWYVNADAAVDGDGSSDKPFNNLSHFDGAGGVDGAGDTIFLESSSNHYTAPAGGLQLETNEQLIGQSAGLVVPDGSGGSGTVTLVAASGANAVIDGGVVLASGNTVKGVSDATIGNLQGHEVTEDATTPTLSVSGHLSVSDPEGQSTFNTTVTPVGSPLGQLTITSSGDYTYAVDNTLPQVQQLAAGEDKTETFTVSSFDGTTKAVSFTIHGVQDAPLLQFAPPANATDDAPIPLQILVQTVDDSGTLSTVSIEGIPPEYTLSTGTPNLANFFDGDGHWEVPASALSTLMLVPGDGATAGTLTLKVSVASIEGGQQAFATQTVTFDVGLGQGEIVQRVVDGYIAGAFVFGDANGNGVFDAGEASATTALDGTFTLHNAHGTLIMTGGTDISTGLAFTGTLKAPDGSTVVTPLTTLVTSLLPPSVPNGPPPTPDQVAAATLQVTKAFGIPDGIDLTTFDPVPAATAGHDATATAVFAAGVQVQSTVAQISAVGATNDIFSAIAGAITAAGTDTTIDLSNASTVQSIVVDSGVSNAGVDAVTTVVSAANSSIHNATDVTTIAQAGQVAQGATATQLAQIAQGGFDANAAQQLADSIPQQVSVAVVPVSPPISGTSGNDVLVGTAGIDTIDGLAGNDQISGGAGDDLLFGSAGNDRIAGNAGNDHIDGGAGFDRALYTDAGPGGITVNMALGTVSGAGVDSDILTNVEGIVGSAFADTYDARGFTGNSGVPGTPIGYNEFEGGAGDDTVYGTVNAQGAYLTRVSYVSATAGVIVNLATGVADSADPNDHSVGHDTFVGPGVQSVWGSAFADTLTGSSNPFGTIEVFSGFAGNDTINGGGGFDRADYNQDPTTTSGITVHLAAGTVTGDASIGTDTLISVEGVRGTNFADTYDATGFGTNPLNNNVGSLGTFNEFTGGGGNDTIIGNGFTRISFNNATAGVTVDLQTGATPGTGTADGDASVGHDTFSGVNAVQGSMFNDTIYGSNITTVTEVFTGNGGDDYIDGRGGFDIASYNNIYLSTGSISVNMAAGIVTGDSSIGTDTLKSIEGIQGTVNADTYDATGYGNGAPTTLNVGNNGTFNQFEGLGGNDTITGNGNTRVIYANALAAVTVNLALGTAQGTAANDAAAIGTDTFTLINGVDTVNSVTGSAFDDTLTGDGNSNTFIGGAGSDTIDGGANTDMAIFSGARANYTITANSPAAGQTTVTDNVGTDGTDTLKNIEVLQFSDSNHLIASGSLATPINLTGFGLGPVTSSLISDTGTNNDFIRINTSLSNHVIDLGGGSGDTVLLGPSGAYTLNLVNVEQLTGTSGDDTVTLVNNASNITIGLGGGNNTLNLAAGTNTIAASLIQHINGSASNDVLTLSSDPGAATIDLGAGIDSLNLNAPATGVTVNNIENVNGSAGADVITIANTAGTTTVTGGGGADVINASAAPDVFRFTSVSDSSTATGVDTINNFDATLDTIQLAGVAGLAGPIHFIAGTSFDAVSQPEAILNGNQLQIDVNGDKNSDIIVTLNNLTGTLRDANFSVIFAGDSGDNTLTGTAVNDRLQGFAGNDAIDGGVGFDRAIYADATGGIAFNLASGSVTGPGVGTDTLTNIEGIVGTNFDDTFTGAGFTGNSGIPGTPIGFNEFEGGAGNDTVTGTINSQGAALTRVSYVSATAGVTVNLAAGTADGDASVGHDTFTNTITNVFGSNFADNITGSNNPFGTVEVFDGRGGNDIINGGGGFDRVDYNNDTKETSGITVNLAAGTVTGSSVAGNDTLISIEAVRGTNFADTYNAGGFNATSTNAGSLGTFNEFTGNGGNDIINGNGNTRISFNNATAGVTVDLQTDGITHHTGTPGTGTADGDASVGHDTFSGVNAVQGSMYDDTIFGSDSSVTETFTGNGGNDHIDGRGGFDIASYNNIYLSTGGITVNMGAGSVTGDSSIGTDTLLSIEGIQGTINADTYNASTYGTAGATNIGNFGTFNQFEGLGGDDSLTGNFNTRAMYINAQAGVAVTFGAGGTGTAHSITGDDAHVGNDTFTGGVNSVTGSSFADALDARSYTGPNNNFNTIQGYGGDDTIIGNGNTQIFFNNASDGVTIQMATGQSFGTAANDVAAVGHDTFTGVFAAVGSGFADVYDATGYGVGGAANVGTFGTFNQFEGQGGNDTIIGNGNTQIRFDSASGSVTVNMANGTADGNASVGHDTFTGVNSVFGSAGNDSLTGSNGNDTLNGSGGNDTLVGSGGSDTLIGGTGADNFLFVVASDSTIASHDTITDFSHIQGDTIDFTNIAGATGYQGMLADHGTNLAANSVGWVEDTVSNTTTVYVNTTATVEAQGSAQMEIVLNGVNLGLTANDFHLH